MSRSDLYVILTLVTSAAPGVVRGAEEAGTLPLPEVQLGAVHGDGSSSLRPRIQRNDEGRAAFLQSFPLDPVAEISRSSYDAIVFGDTDHDGLNEVIVGTYAEIDDGQLHYWILEEKGGNAYSVEMVGGILSPYAVGDLDQDGKTDLVGQPTSSLYVYEAVDAASYPTQLVWVSPNISNIVGYPRIADSDRDGRMEIIHSQNGIGGTGNLLIIESTGDDAYSLVYVAQLLGSTGTVEKVIADLDGDGFLEVVTSGGNGHFYVFESVADNTWQATWTESTGMINAFGLEGGLDTDGNGKPELFVMGNFWTGVRWEWTTMVYEAVCDNEYERVASFGKYDGFGGGSYNALGDLDGDGQAEYAMQGNCCLWLYQATGPGVWEQVAEIPNPHVNGHYVGLHMFDVNRNGREELFWLTSIYPSMTLVLEHPPATSGVGDLGRGVVSLSVFPNPFQGEARLRAPAGEEAATRLAIYDVAGRLVERRLVTQSAGGQLLWQAQNMNPGVYWLRLESRAGSVLASGRAVVLR